MATSNTPDGHRWFDEILPPEHRAEIESWVEELNDILNTLTMVAVAIPEFIDARMGDDQG